MSNMIVVSGDGATVKYDTFVEFSGLSEDAIKKHIKRKREVLVKNGLSYPYDLSEALNYSEMNFDERSAMLLMTYLPSSKAVDSFKEKLINEFFALRDRVRELREQELNDCLLAAKTKVVEKDKYIDVLVEERNGKQKEVNRLKKAVSSKSKFKEYDGKHGALSKYIRDRGLKMDVSDLFDYLEFKGWVGTTIIEEKKRFMTAKGIAKNGGQPDKSVPVFSFDALDKTMKTKEFKKFIDRGNNKAQGKSK